MIITHCYITGIYTTNLLETSVLLLSLAPDFDQAAVWSRNIENRKVKCRGPAISFNWTYLNLASWQLENGSNSCDIALTTDSSTAALRFWEAMGSRDAAAVKLPKALRGLPKALRKVPPDSNDATMKKVSAAPRDSSTSSSRSSRSSPRYRSESQEEKCPERWKQEARTFSRSRSPKAKQQVFLDLEHQRIRCFQLVWLWKLRRLFHNLASFRPLCAVFHVCILHDYFATYNYNLPNSHFNAENYDNSLEFGVPHFQETHIGLPNFCRLSNFLYQDIFLLRSSSGAQRSRKSPKRTRLWGFDVGKYGNSLKEATSDFFGWLSRRRLQETGYVYICCVYIYDVFKYWWFEHSWNRL